MAASMAWDNAVAYVNIYHRHIICRRHWLPACLRSWTQLNFAGKSVVNAWDRLCVGDKCSHMPQLSQAVPAAMSQVGRWHMRTRLYWRILIWLHINNRFHLLRNYAQMFVRGTVFWERSLMKTVSFYNVQSRDELRPIACERKFEWTITFTYPVSSVGLFYAASQS